MELSTFLKLLSALGWSIVYIEIIRLGFKYKTYGMPLFVLALNFCWELLYGILGFSPDSIQRTINIIWSCLDLIIVITFFAYGYRFFPKGYSKKQFIAWGITVFVVAFIMQLLFYYQFPVNGNGEAFSAFLQNVVMSLLFINMLVTRSTTEGQSMTIAISKWIGTLAPTILLFLSGISMEPCVPNGQAQASISLFNNTVCLPNWSWFLLVFGIFCFVFDILYIVLLKRRIQLEKQGNLTTS